jgi:hypothetical protein
MTATAETITTESGSKAVLSRLQQRALAACRISGYATPPEYIAGMARDQLYMLLDTMELPTGSAS